MSDTTFDFKRLGDVDTVDEIQDSDTVLVVRNGEVYQVDKSKVGGSGAGGYLLEPAEGEVYVGGDGYICINSSIDGLQEAVEAGSPVTLALNWGVVLDDGYDEALGTGYGIVTGITFAEAITSYEESGIKACGGVIIGGESYIVVFAPGVSFDEG